MKTIIPTRLNQTILNGIVGGFDRNTAKFVLIRKMTPVLFLNHMFHSDLDSVADIIRESHDLSPNWCLPSANDVTLCERVIARFFEDSFQIVTLDGIIFYFDNPEKILPYVLMISKVREVELVHESPNYIVEPAKLFLN